MRREVAAQLGPPFLHPVHVGDIVHTHSQVNWAGRSSMEIGVRVETEPWTDASGPMRHVASAYFVFVAIAEDGCPRAVPGLAPETPDEVRRRIGLAAQDATVDGLLSGHQNLVLIGEQRSRSEVVAQALTLLREKELEGQYAEALAEWQSSGDAEIWDHVVGDGLTDGVDAPR